MSAARSVVAVASLLVAGAATATAQEKPPISGSPTMTSSSGGWITSQGGAIPPGAKPVGYESGGFLYACRAAADGGMHPGKVRPGFDGCYIPLNGQETSVRQYEVLVGDASWEIARDGNVPQGAVETGRTRSGQPLYACRSAGAAGQLTPGKTGAGIRGCAIGVGGVEQTQGNYEVLIQR